MMRAIVLGRPRLGQLPGEWMARARKAVDHYEMTLAEASMVANDDARGEILKWIGRADGPGRPGERYYATGRDLMAAQASGPDQVYSEDVAQHRVEQLEAMVSEFDMKVSNALEAYGSLEGPLGAGGAAQGAGR